MEAFLVLGASSNVSQRPTDFQLEVPFVNKIEMPSQR